MTKQKTLRKSKGERRSQSPTSQNPPCWRPPWLNTACGGRKHPESEGLARDRRKLTSTIKPEPARHTAEQSSWLPGRPFAMKPLALSARVSPGKIHFQVLDKSPLSAPEGSPSYRNVAMLPFEMGSPRAGSRSGSAGGEGKRRH